MRGGVAREIVKDLESSKAVVPNPTTFEEFLKTDTKTRQVLKVE